MHRGSLTVVGTGITFAAHLTPEARACIEQADKVLYGVADPAMAAWLTELNPSAESFSSYRMGQPRRATYERWVEQILNDVRNELTVCVALYGHPGVCVPAAHEAVRRARSAGFRARMLPGISADACLFADLCIDPAEHGCQSYEATDFLLHRRAFDPSSVLILRQIGQIGEAAYTGDGPNREGLRVLSDVLEASYDETHEVVVYEAARFAIHEPVIQRVPLTNLPDAPVTDLSTLYIPPRPASPPDPDMLKRLGLLEAEA